MNIEITTVIIPSLIWKRCLSVLVKDALVCERRILKESNLDIERSRYHLINKQIEKWAKKWFYDQPSVSCLTLDDNYLSELYFFIKKYLQNAEHTIFDLYKARIASSFIPPDALTEHISLVEEVLSSQGNEAFPNIQKRNIFLKQVVANVEQYENTPGIIEFQTPFINNDLPIIDYQTSNNQIKRIQELSNPIIQFDDIEENVNLYQSLRSNIECALLTGEGVNFSNPTHIVISEILHEYVYKENNEPNSAIRIVYGDGSEAAPFPIRQLEYRSREEIKPILENKPLSASLISMRHLEMDPHVQMAWLPNQQASQSRFFSDTDAYSFDATLDLLKQIKQPLVLHLYQTGLQPAVVGFYRALVTWYQESKENRNLLIVIPMYYQKDSGYRQGNYWN